jgi:hypothetical protein
MPGTWETLVVPASLRGIVKALREKRLWKRGCLKSPVRENRTTGSVRGLLGNWQSYRDVPPCYKREHSHDTYRVNDLEDK